MKIFKRNGTNPNKPSAITRSSTAPASSTAKSTPSTRITVPPPLDRTGRAKLLQLNDHEIFCTVKSQWDWVLEELCKRTNKNKEDGTTTATTTPERKVIAVHSVAELPSAKLAAELAAAAASSSSPERMVPLRRNSNADGSESMLDRSNRRNSRRQRPTKALTTPGAFMLCVEVVFQKSDIPNNNNNDNNATALQAFHGNSEAFDGLEDKDEFVRTLQHCRVEHLELSPPSRLISWDVTKEECRNIVGESLPVLTSNNDNNNTNNTSEATRNDTADNNTNDNNGEECTTTTTTIQPSTIRMAVLKEPMGSKGTGVFFVKNADEIHEIIEQNRKKAVEEPGFLDRLIEQKGRIPKFGTFFYLSFAGRYCWIDSCIFFCWLVRISRRANTRVCVMVHTTYYHFVLLPALLSH
jgi:hypothetical protein